MLSPELVEKIYDYLEEEIGLEKLEEWLVSRLPGFLSNFGKRPEADLVATLEHGLAELSSNILSEDEFRQEIKDYLKSQDLTLAYKYPETESESFTSTSSNVFHADFPFTYGWTAVMAGGR